MKATKEALSPTRIKITIEVPFEELSDDLASAYKRIGAQIRVPGFRPGKVPARIVDQRIGRGYVLNEALPGALDRFYGQALQEAEVDAISAPEDLDVQEFHDGEQLIFSAEVDVRPEVTCLTTWPAWRSPSTTSRSPTRMSRSSCRACVTGSRPCSPSSARSRTAITSPWT